MITLCVCIRKAASKKITGYVPPTGTHRGFEISRILHDCGVRYIIASFNRLMKHTEIPDPSVLDTVFVENDVVTMKEQEKNRQKALKAATLLRLKNTKIS